MSLSNHLGVGIQLPGVQLASPATVELVQEMIVTMRWSVDVEANAKIEEVRLERQLNIN